MDTGRVHLRLLVLRGCRGLHLGLLVALATGCTTPAVTISSAPGLCQVWVYPPNTLPVLWTCTAGQASTPPRLPCVQGDGGADVYPVADCVTCTPAELIQLDPGAKCTPGGQELPWKYAQDGGMDLGEE